MGGRGASSGGQRTQKQHPTYGGNTSSTYDVSDAMVADVAKAFGVNYDTAREYAESINKFTGSGYDDMRYSQQSGHPSRDAENLERAIAVAPKWAGGPTYRGLEGLDSDLFREMTTVGNEIDINYGTASWSTDRDTARSFSGGGKGSVVFVHDSPRQNGTSIKSLSRYNSEDEVLCSKNNRYKVTRVERPTDSWEPTYVHVKTV